MTEIRMKETPELKNNIDKLKEFYWERTKAKVIKKATKDMVRINNL